MKYPNCQTESREGVEFCGECVQSLQTEIVCPQCNHTNTKGNKFCEKCGNTLTKQASLKPKPKKPSTIRLTSFACGCYQEKKFLDEDGKKNVYLSHDTFLGRDVTFAQIMTETPELASLRSYRKRYWKEFPQHLTNTPG